MEALAKKYIPVRVGRSGTKVHLGYASGGVQKGRVYVTKYHYVCSVVNSHNINQWPNAKPVDFATEITCAKCKLLMEKHPEYRVTEPA